MRLGFRVKPWFSQNPFMTDQAPRLQFDLDADAIRLLHRSVAYYLERWPGGQDPREQQDLQTLQRLLYAALLECTLHEDGQR
jgi:hypothetical protein